MLPTGVCDKLDGSGRGVKLGPRTDENELTGKEGANAVQRSRFTKRARRRGAALALAAATVLAALVVPAVAQAKPANVKVMTRNIYLGADLTPALTADTAAGVFMAAGDIWEGMLETNFRARAARLAEEIAATKPDAIGLQEVALWRRGARGDLGPDSTADEVVNDFLEILQTQLRNRGLNYRTAVKQQEADITLPVDRTEDGIPEFLGRLTMHDAILVKRHKRLRIKNARGGNYPPQATLPVPVDPLGIEIPVTRGWAAVDITKVQGKKRRGKKRQAKTFRFVNTHLEAFAAFFSRAQAFNLVNSNLMSTRLPVILVGDLNSDPLDESEDDTIPLPPQFPLPRRNEAYLTFIDSGFADRGVTQNTCCHDDDLLNDTVDFDSRIDHILSKGRVQRVNARRTGDDPALRTPAGLWPSDHAGVVSTLRVR